MTTPAAPPLALGDGRTARAVLRSRFGRARLWLVLGLLLLTAALVALLAAGKGGTGALAPDNPAPDGAKAVVEVLRGQGVDVKPATRLDAALDLLAGGAGTTLLFHDPSGRLNEDQLGALAAETERTVLVEPDGSALRALAPGIRAGGLIPDTGGPALAADCPDPAAAAAGSISRGGYGYRGPWVCFAPEGAAGAAAAAGPAGAVAGTGDSTADSTADDSAVVVGNAAVFANGTITEEGNAALALHVLGAAPRLVWYQPGVEDIAAGTGPVDPASLLPAWVRPAGIWLGAVGLVGALWRGRRLGPLVQEPLPVLVPAAETAEGRARLYQSARAAERAARNLRAAFLVRAADRLRLGPAATVPAVVAALAEHTGRPAAGIAALLDTAGVTTDRALVAWAQQLEQLENLLDEGTTPR